MNFQQLVAKLKLESSRQGASPASPTTSSKDDSRLWGWVADEWVSLQTSGHLWKFMRQTRTFNTAIGQSSYLPAEIGGDFQRLWPSEFNGYQPRLTDAGQVSYLEPEFEYDQFRRVAIPGSQPGVPRYYAQSPSGALLLSPSPDRIVSIEIDVLKAPTYLLEPAHTPTGLPEWHQLILVWGALKRLAVDDAAGELLQRANTEYSQAWDRLWMDQGPQIGLDGLSL